MKNLEDEIKDLVDVISQKDKERDNKISKLDTESHYVHVQSMSSNEWIINHPLNKKCSVTITDSAGTVVQGRVVINDGKKVIVSFKFPFSGEALLN